MFKLLRVQSIVCVAAAIWIFGAGPAWAGGGGMDAASLLSSLCGFASTFGIPCPQYPTYANTATKPATPISPLTPIVLELAAWENVSPDSVRMTDSDCKQLGMLLGGTTPYCPQVAVNAINGPAKSPLAHPRAALPALDSLAFISNPTPMVPLTVTQNLPPNATSQVYAVAEAANGQPDTLDLFFENLTGTTNEHVKGQVVAAVSFPLAVLVNGASLENSVVATLQITATCNGTAACLIANVLADFSGNGTNPKIYSAAALGLNFAHYSSPSPTYEVQIPLLVNTGTDPFYFLSVPLPGCANGSNPISGYCNAFSATSPPNGFAPAFLTNTVIGMAPSAAPQCPGNPPGTPGQPGTPCPGSLPSSPSQPLSPTFGFCAYLSSSAYLSGNPDAAFFLAIGTDGTTYVSSPVNPALSGAPYPACPS
jgi:hypothetical protein